MARKRTATLLYSTEEVLTVLEFFAVGDLSTAVLLRAVKGGVNLPQTNISAIFKVHLSLFLIAQFFITQLTLPSFIVFSTVYAGKRKKRRGTPGNSAGNSSHSAEYGSLFSSHSFSILFSGRVVER